MDIKPINDESFLIRFEDEISYEIHKKVKFYYEYIVDEINPLSVVSGYNSILVTYDFSKIAYSEIKRKIEEHKYSETETSNKRTVVYIPVCYDESFGLDIKRVSELNNLSISEVIKKHTKPEYLVYMIGFTPGFPYLGGMDQSIATPRLESPRTKIEAGSVGIGGKQTGIYPSATPGGWNIIGKTPLTLFDMKKEIPALLQMGYYIKFEQVSKNEFNMISEKVKNNTYTPKVEVVV